MKFTFLKIAVLATLAFPVAAQAQGTVRGAQEGAAMGTRIPPIVPVIAPTAPPTTAPTGPGSLLMSMTKQQG